MKKKTTKVALLSLAIAAYGGSMSHIYAADDNKTVDPDAGLPVLTINGTGKTATVSVSSANLIGKEITVKVPHGFEASKAKVDANGKASINIKLVSSKDTTSGRLVLRSGDIRKYVKLVGVGSPLPVKSIAANSVSKGGKANFEHNFKPGTNGYTIEFKLAPMEEGQNFYPYFVDQNGYGFKAYVSSGKVGVYNSRYEKPFSNPATDGVTGGGKFYNADGQAHTYRIAVTPDNRAFVYRDGVKLGVLRTDDYGPQPNFASGDGEMKENLLRNSDFEGEFETNESGELATAIQGWDIVIGDRWNSEQNILAEEIDNVYDKDNHVFMLRPYKWAAGWSDGILEQVVDVVPNETYTLSALAKGGQDGGKDGGNTGKITIEEVQDGAKRVSNPITSETWEEYSLDYTTSADCKQIVVRFTDGRGGWGNKIKPIYVDNVKLTGVSRTYSPKFGYENKGAKIEYVAFDNSGAYAPEAPEISVKF